jgi:hypothetical protein
MTIQPTAVYPPGASPSGMGGSQGGGYQDGQYRLHYTPPGQNVNAPGPFTRAYNRIPQQSPRVTMPDKVPKFLRSAPLTNRSIVFNMWIIAMITVGFDEWHNLGILPRPARLWDTSLVYGVLVLAGIVDALVPLVNALAIGYTITLLVQYFQGNLTPSTTGSSNSPSGSSTTSTSASQVIFPTPTTGIPVSQQFTGGQ